jgi:hypothetical protein
VTPFRGRLLLSWIQICGWGGGGTGDGERGGDGAEGLQTVTRGGWGAAVVTDNELTSMVTVAMAPYVELGGLWFF